jgi:hypothetical protein
MATSCDTASTCYHSAMGFFGKLFGAGSATFESMAPEQRLEMLRKHESEPKVKQLIVAAQQLVGSTDSGNSKMAQARLSYSDLKAQQPLIWVNLVLAIYDQGHPIFDEVMGSSVRDALRHAKDELVKKPDEKKQKLFSAIEKDIEIRKLTSLKFLQDAPAEPMPHAMIMPTAPDAVSVIEPSSEKTRHKKNAE